MIRLISIFNLLLLFLFGNSPGSLSVGTFLQEQRIIFNSDNGLPSNDVRDIVSTNDGTVFVSTSKGLIAYSNKQWVNIDGLENTDIWLLASNGNEVAIKIIYNNEKDVVEKEINITSAMKDIKCNIIDTFIIEDINEHGKIPDTVELKIKIKHIDIINIILNDKILLNYDKQRLLFKIIEPMGKSIILELQDKQYKEREELISNDINSFTDKTYSDRGRFSDDDLFISYSDLRFNLSSKIANDINKKSLFKH